MSTTILPLLWWAFVASILAPVLIFLVIDIVRKMSGSGLLLSAGLLAMFFGERVFGDGSWRVPITTAAVVAVLMATGLRAYAWSRSDGSRKDAHRVGLVLSAFVLGALALYTITLDTAVTAFGLTAEAADRWTGAWGSVWPILLFCGVLPILMLDRALAAHPISLPMGATQQATLSGLATALGIALVFPVNYLAAKHPWEYDAAYFRTAKAGDATRSLVRTLPEPVKVTAFFAPASDVRMEIEGYFAPLLEASSGRLTFAVVDQPLAPKLSEELKIRENGYVVLSRGEGEDAVTEKFKVGTELKKARRELKKLDSTVQQHLMKLTRDEQVVYLTVGHGEASPRESENLLRKLNLFKKLVESQNYDVKNLGVAEGLANEIPEDASVLIVAAPTEPFSSEEVEAVGRYLDRGGALFVLIDPETDKLQPLLDKLGITAGTAPLAHATKFIPQKRGVIDRGLLVTNRFGSHASVKTLSKNSTQLALVVPTVVGLDKNDDAPGKRTTVIRTFPDTWADDGDFEQSDAEKGQVYDIGIAVTGSEDAEKSYRALVVGDVSVLADNVLAYSTGNQQFVLDSVRWLVGDDEIEGDVESEEDVKIQHTNDEDVYYFYLTVLGVPMFVLSLGAIVIRVRRRKA